MILNKVYNIDCIYLARYIEKGSISLIYIDPPYGTQKIYKNKKSGIGFSDKREERETPDIDRLFGSMKLKAKDKSYLQFMFERLLLLRELLSDDGSIYLHCDWHKSHHLRCIMDEVLGNDGILGEIIWHYEKWTSPGRNFQKNHDTILFYKKNNTYIFNEQREITDNLKGKYEKGYLIGGGGGSEGLVVYDKTKPKVQEMIKSGKYKIVYTEPNGKPLSDVWKIPFINPVAGERTSYPTQKPEALLERIIKASSNPGDIILDCFMGSGTTCAVAQKLGRRWIGCDINTDACEISKKRILKINSKENG